jgi:hypothetical protein
MVLRREQPGRERARGHDPAGEGEGARLGGAERRLPLRRKPRLVRQRMVYQRHDAPPEPCDEILGHGPEGEPVHEQHRIRRRAGDEARGLGKILRGRIGIAPGEAQVAHGDAVLGDELQHAAGIGIAPGRRREVPGDREDHFGQATGLLRDGNGTALTPRPLPRTRRGRRRIRAA